MKDQIKAMKFLKFYGLFVPNKTVADDRLSILCFVEKIRLETPIFYPCVMCSLFPKATF